MHRLFSGFFSFVALLTAFLLLTIFYAISWQINNLHLKSTAGQLFIFLSVSGAILFSKVAVLQFNEPARVDAAFAREASIMLGFDKWMNLGQRPVQNSSPDPWPQPWVLRKTHPSLLPEGFNLLVIVVDALRGDAFHSAGYHRNPTPFLDRWAHEEAISFRRAYSHGGGSFAAFPFLVAGRSRFDLYGPGLYRQNLYFKIARAEGIQHYMLMKGFGPRDIYPPYDDAHMGISLVPLILGMERQLYLQRDVVGRASFKRRYFLYRNWQ